MSLNISYNGLYSLKNLRFLFQQFKFQSSNYTCDMLGVLLLLISIKVLFFNYVI